MNQIVRLAIAAAVAGFSSGALAQLAETQIQLTEKHVEGFIAVQAGISAVVEKSQGAIFSDSGKHKAELDAVTRKHGFKSFAEYETVAANISMVMAGIDPQTKQFTDPVVAIKKEIADVTADKSISEQDKKQILEELNEALKSAEPIQFPSNIELVKKYYDKIDAGLT